MFDLFRSRAKSVRYLLGALLLLVALSMVITLVPGFGSGGGADTDIVIAQIGSERITIPDVQAAVQRQVRQGKVPSELLGTFAPQVVDSLVTEYALAYEAHRLGYRVSDRDLAAAIHQIMPSLWQDGKFVGKDAYSMLLSQQNMTIPEFESELSRELAITRMRDVALEGIIATPQEIEREYKRKNEKIKVEYVKLTPEMFRQQVNPTPEQLKSYFETNKAGYRIPEKRSLGIILFDQARLENSVNPTDADLLKVYNQNKDQYRTPERVKVRHILLKTTGMTPQQEAQVKAKAEALLKEIKAGGNFAELAKKNSEDPGSAKNGGELPDWVVRGQTVPEFEKVAFSLPVGQTSDLVKTQYGYHIIQVLAHEQARLRPFDEVKSELAAEYKKQRVNDLMQQMADKSQAGLTKDPQHPEQVAAELGGQFVRADNIGPGDPIPVVGKNADFETSITGLKKNEVSQPVLLPGNRLVDAVVLDVTPAHPATYDEVSAQVREAYVRTQTAKIFEARATELAQKAESMGGDLEKAAKSMGFEAKTSGDFDRQGAVEGLGPAAAISAAFDKAAGAVLGPITIPDGRVVVKVVSKTPADMTLFASQRDSLRDEVKSKKARDRNALFEAGVRAALTKEGKIKIHQDVLNRLLASYRG